TPTPKLPSVVLRIIGIIIFRLQSVATPQPSTLSLHDALPISTWARPSADASCTSAAPRSRTTRSTSDSPPTARSPAASPTAHPRSEEHTPELQSPYDLVCRLLLEKKNTSMYQSTHQTQNSQSS